MPEPVNPYAAPQYQEEYPQVPIPAGGNLASLGQRFMGRLGDNLGAIGVSALALFTVGEGMELFRNRDTGAQVVASLIFFAYALPFNALQWYLISTSGQSIGKKLSNTRIVRDDGSPVGFTSGVVLREWIMVALGSIPVVGSFLALLDAIFIFVGDERKTLHDRIAGTKVVDASVVFRTDAELGLDAELGQYAELREHADAPRKRRKKRKKKINSAANDPAAVEPARPEDESTKSTEP